MTCSIKRKDQFAIGFQGIALTEMTYETSEDATADSILSDFLNSKCLTSELISYQPPHQGPANYLPPAIELEKIVLSDFRRFSYSDLVKFLVEFINDPEWGEEGRKEFSLLLDWFLDKYHGHHQDYFYMISKDWFEPGNEILNDSIYWVYPYYLILISVDLNNNTFTISEWAED